RPIVITIVKEKTSWINIPVCLQSEALLLEVLLKLMLCLLSSVCVFETIFFVETVHTSICLSEFLTSCIEWM
ncbi:hypothetical protein QP102_09620, partial [Streptococcus agalactiae]